MQREEREPAIELPLFDLFRKRGGEGGAEGPRDAGAEGR